ncbi:forkhead domain-containing protein [Nannizzia gypsea CBS 118893]|uniref:Forkhead domain-containing protein n=1 Tax=Arthroderma gypseum (strain ATCC MYA-4604 / CBS 118893) TaxID=535722 RepID=E4V0E0_ARTGP|nr:forkhead domain-containing protein [Nannizzia gypsea CBS 118893]EFR03077.1 forkhead domain-containing protein [Nannizzia gypsea CBS 118893]
MDDDTGILCPSICAQMHHGNSPSFTTSQGGEISPSQHAPGSVTTSLHQHRCVISHPSILQQVLDPNLLGDALPQQRQLSSTTHSHESWGSVIEPNTFCNTHTMTYGIEENKGNILSWEDEAPGTIDLEFDLLASTYPLLDELHEFECLGYQATRQPNTSTPSQRNCSQILDNHYPNPASTCSRPSFDSSTSRPESAIYPPLSPENSVESSSPVDFHVLYGSDPIVRSVPEAGNLASEDETDDDSVSSEEPYARLIWRALMSAPGHKMVLKEIYEWFEKNTSKAKNSDSKGWQNSIRHNLSMNAAFEGVKEVLSPGAQTRKSGNAWVLTERAIRHGVQSTTRYRKPGVHKKSQKSDHPAPQRQKSGARGGRAAKKAAKYRRAMQESQRLDRNSQNAPPSDIPFNQPDFLAQTASCVEYGSADTVNNYMLSDYGLENLLGCNELIPRSPLFYPDLDLDGSQQLSGSTVLGGQPIGRDFNSLLQ